MGLLKNPRDRIREFIFNKLCQEDFAIGLIHLVSQIPHAFAMAPGRDKFDGSPAMTVATSADVYGYSLILVFSLVMLKILFMELKAV